MAHRNARLTEFGRLLLGQRITELGWPPAQAAESLGGSRATAYKWLGRSRAQGRAGLGDRSCLPQHCPPPSAPARSVGCWPPGVAAVRAHIDSATTWGCPARRSMGSWPATA